MPDKKEYRCQVNLPYMCGLYLSEKKWITKKSISQIVQELIEKDMIEHPEIVESIDELNK